MYGYTNLTICAP